MIKTMTLLFMLLSFVTSQAADDDNFSQVKAKFLVNYEAMCLKGVVKHKLKKKKFEEKCACQVKQIGENLSGDEIIKLSTSKDKFQYPELKRTKPMH